jgi:hypothetical protein
MTGTGRHAFLNDESVIVIPVAERQTSVTRGTSETIWTDTTEGGHSVFRLSDGRMVLADRIRLTENLVEIPEKAIERIPALSYRDDAIGELRKHVKRCHARSVQRFYQWLRTTLAKVSYPQLLSYFKPEDDPKPEAPVGQSEPFSFISNGGLALIDVDKAIWKIPIVRLDFARSVWPVYVKQLPALEHPERRKITGFERTAKNAKLEMAARDAYSSRGRNCEMGRYVAAGRRPEPHCTIWHFQIN